MYASAFWFSEGAFYEFPLRKYHLQNNFLILPVKYIPSLLYTVYRRDLIQNMSQSHSLAYT